MYATVDELLERSLDDLPWFMRATVDELLVPSPAQLLGGRENDIDVFEENGGRLGSEQGQTKQVESATGKV